ncbi:MAG: GPR endopeptidase [Oscillospiraceae bacterium]|nr:GPR endopeptidase [Oscillospiraceae bacterium]
MRARENGESSDEVNDLDLRTDLAVEAKKLWEDSAGVTTLLPGVIARKARRHGIELEKVVILNEAGADALKKPVGTYLTVDLQPFAERERHAFRRTALALAEALGDLLKPFSGVLVAGLGNREITPDAIGPHVLEHILVTRHLLERGKLPHGVLTPVSTIVPGVLGITGIESVELVRSARRIVGADCVLVVDALASCDPDRLCRSVQLSDTGLVPGSGVGNSRPAFSERELGVPVYAIGVPTVMDGAPLFSCEGRAADAPKELIVTPRDIDSRVREIGKLIGYAIDLALQPKLSFDDIPSYLS